MQNLLIDYLTKQQASKWLNNFNDYENISNNISSDNANNSNREHI